MIVDAKNFIRFANHNLERWQLLTNIRINHPVSGPGQIKSVDINKNNDISIYIEFENQDPKKIRCFSEECLRICGKIELPNQVANRILSFYPNTPQNQINTHQDLLTQPVCAASERPAKPTMEPKSAFNDNQKVVLRTNPNKVGIVSKVKWLNQQGYYYDVFFSANETRTVREVDLKPWIPTATWGNLEDLLRDLALIKLQRPQSDSLYALYSSRTKFEVYQFKPAVKFLSNPDQRILIADEVGLGKTIEAGIIYLELEARLGLDQVFIVCPSSLKHKWQDEMKSRFDEEFEIMDAQRIERFFGDYARYGEGLRLRGIASLETIRLKKIAEQFADIKLDMVIIDEAHHCRNTSTLANAVASTLVENADAALLLTATPLQMGQSDLFNLLNILSPGEFDNLNAFLDRLEPNQLINEAASILSTGAAKKSLQVLRLVESTNEKQRFIRNPYYQEVVRLLSKDYLLEQEMITAQRRLIELNTLSSIFTRTRKRDIQENAPIRTAQTLSVNFTPEERKLYDQVVEEARQDFEARHYSGWGSGWVTIMKERQVSSCISAVMRRKQRESNVYYVPNREDDVLRSEYSISQTADNDNWEYDPTETNGVTPIVVRLARVNAKFRVNTPILATDSKFDVFWAALQQILSQDKKTKAIVFSYFRDTIDYLSERLLGLGVNVRAIHGGYPVMERNNIIEQFRDDPEIRVLISSDVGSEGLDFQFCDTIFNYDLPWNPMKVEQRIGRIDRFGQESKRIRIYNLVIENSIESRILMRLYDRIEIFKHSIGDIEEILGEQIRELTQAVFSSRLTPAEEIKRAEDASRNVLKKKQELEEFEKQKLQFLGQEAIFSTTIEKTIESGKYISEVETRALVQGYINEEFPLTRFEKNKEDETFILIPNDDFVTEIKTFIMQDKKKDATSLQFLKVIRSGKALPLTFSSDLAFQRKLLEFITPRHPLAQAALGHWARCSQGVNRISQLRLKSDTLIPGEYAFFIYSIDSTGVDQNSSLIPITVSKKNGDVYVDLNNQLLRLAQTSSEPTNSFGDCDEAILSPYEDAALLYMTRERDMLHHELSISNEALLNARLTAIEQSYGAKKAHVEKQLSQVDNSSIIRMYQGQLRNMEAKYRAKVNVIKTKANVEVTFSLLLKGCVEVVRND